MILDRIVRLLHPFPFLCVVGYPFLDANALHSCTALVSYVIEVDRAAIRIICFIGAPVEPINDVTQIPAGQIVDDISLPRACQRNRACRSTDIACCKFHLLSAGFASRPEG